MRPTGVLTEVSLAQGAPGHGRRAGRKVKKRTRGGQLKERSVGTRGGKRQTATELTTRRVRRNHQCSAAAPVLLFEADVSQVSVIDTDDAVVLPEEALLLGLASPLQTLDQQAKSPAMFKRSCQQDA